MIKIFASLVFSFTFVQTCFSSAAELQKQKSHVNTLPKTSVYTFNEKPIDLVKHISGKKTLILVWATWCAPCKDEMKWVLKNLDLIENKKGWNLVLLNTDSTPIKKTVEKIKKLSAFDNRLVSMSYYDLNNAWLDESGVDSLPFSVKVNQQGQVTLVKMGQVTAKDL